MEASDAYRAFVANLQSGGEPTLLTYDLISFNAMGPDERARAERLLLDRARHGRDPKAIETLGIVGSPAAIPVLEALGEAPAGPVRSAANRALSKLTPSAEAVRRVGADVVQAGDSLDAAFGAYDLRHMDGPEAIAGLLQALESPQDVARIHAWEGLVEKIGVAEALVKPLQTPLRTLYTRAKTPFPSVWIPAARSIRGHLTLLAGGKGADSLGLVYQPGDPDLVARVWAGYKPDSTAFDIDAVRAMTGHDRSWAESHLYFHLSSRDPRAVVAIDALALPNGPLALSEARQLYAWSDELVAAIDGVLP